MSDSSTDHQANDDDRHAKHQRRMYLRFGAMILTGMVVMYCTMFAGTYAWSHVKWSESRLFMTMTMGGTMGLVMLAWMLNMYQNTKLNLLIVAASLLLLVGGISLDRSQTTVQDAAFMRGMIPHHSLAITRSERSELSDVRVCQLAKRISEAQRREILEMEWLIKDISANGAAQTLAAAQARQVPEFERAAIRRCPAR
jgi:hypothetical protein